MIRPWSKLWQLVRALTPVRIWCLYDLAAVTRMSKDAGTDATRWGFCDLIATEYDRKKVAIRSQ